MEKWKYICLLYCLYSWIERTRAQTWASPPFLAPEPLDVGIQSWEFSKPLDAALIELFEEVEHDVTIAVFNYKGDEKPRIDKFEDKTEINSNLGAKFDKNEKGNWIVVVTRKQDFETPAMQKYTMTIAVGEETHKIKIAVINIDDNPPVIQANERSCSVPENYEGLTNCTFTITDVDGWIDKTTFNIASMPTSGSDHFSMEPKTIPGTLLKMNATLNVIKSLDFESIAVYTLGITATDSGNNTSNNLVTVVRVIDMPDMPPVWTNLTSAITIWEKSINTLSVSAIDGDYEINADINYKIEVTEENEKFFEVEKETGVITINKIDRDTLKKEIFKFTIIAYEVENVTSSINSTIVVVVNDINDHIPEISPSDLSIDILEETYMNLNFSEQIVMTDPDLAENAQYDVKLEEDPKHNWDSAFLIIPNSGYQLGNFTISVVNAALLDYEDENWRNINIKIVATERANSAHIGIRDVKINLVNWNDELPIFENDNMVVNVAEDVKKGFPVATVLAKDRDVNDTVRHSLVTQRNLHINSATGKITTTEDKSFDYESMPIVLVQVIATDDANHTTYATLTVNVTDVNDKPPSLFLPQVKPSLVEEVDAGTEVKTKIYATDPDTQAELKFSIDWDSSTAYKSSSPTNESFYREHLIIKTIYPEGKKKYAEALLVVSGRIDYEEFDVMYLTIVVTDVTTAHNEDSALSSLTLIINDINDNPPEFEDPEEMRVLENQKSGILIGKVTAYDIDGPGNNEVKYSIMPINGTKDKLVQIDPKTGIIKVDEYAGIDAEEYEYLYYNVSATDSVHKTILPIKIYVIDENDEIPAIPPKRFNSTIHIKEKSENGTEIFPVYAIDKDRTSPFNNVSYLINTDYPQLFQYFSMGKFDGLLKVNLIDNSTKLDRDFGQSNFSVFIRLRDNNIDVVGYPSNMITEMITVILDDINDQIPRLPNLANPAVNISEETETDVKVLTVTADDRDDPNTVNTKVFYEIKDVVKADDKISNLREDCSILFKVKTIEKKHAEISTNCHLKGYYGVWSLKLYVTDLGADPGPLDHTKMYNILITDYNYNNPVIVYPIAGKLIRLSRIQQINSQLLTHDGQFLENFFATDKDYGESGVVTFTISHGVELFKIVALGNNSGQLQLTSILNFNQSHTFELIITATDNGAPKQKTTTQTQKIIFISTEGPEFTINTFKTEFHENTTGLNEFMIIPQAYDMINEGIQDDSSVDIYYFLANEDGDMPYFELDKETRNLTLKKQLDREEKETMSILVIATTNRNGPTSNPREKATLNITITILDVNDNPPNFENKDYFGGVALEDAVGKVVLTVKATDADLNDSLSYSIIDHSLTISHNSLEGISVPFKIKISTGELLLDFKTTSYMTGYFSFDILVQDEVLHEDKTHVKVYIIAQNNRVTFTFKNKITDLNDNRSYIIKAFTEIFGYVCNIDYLEKNNFARDVQSDDITVLTAHFINEETNLPVQADIITLAANDLETITNLKASLLTKNLYLVDVPTSSSMTETEDLHDVIQWILICLTTFFFISSIALLVAYIVRIRGLTEKLDKLAITNYGSHDSGLDKIGIMPNSNKFALEGSNPMWKTEPVNAVEDNISRGSGDSDLIGIEDNPDFDYDQNSKVAKNGKLNTFVLPNDSTAFPVKSLVENEKSKKDEFSC